MTKEDEAGICTDPQSFSPSFPHPGHGGLYEVPGNKVKGVQSIGPQKQICSTTFKVPTRAEPG